MEVPTLFWMNAPGRARAIACVAFQPVQWAGTITSGASRSGGDSVCDDRLEQRSGQVEPADHRVQLADAGQALGVAADIDHAGMPAPGEDDQPAPGDVGDQRLVVQYQRVRFPAFAAPGLVNRESFLKAGDPVNLPRDQHRPIEQERRLPCSMTSKPASARALRLVVGNSTGSPPGMARRRRAQNSGWMSTGRFARPSRPMRPDSCVP